MTYSSKMEMEIGSLVMYNFIQHENKTDILITKRNKKIYL